MNWLAILTTAAVIFPAGALAGALAPAHVSTVGTVRTNSSLLPSGSTIYSGDMIATGEDGLAVVTSRDMGRLEVRPASRVEFGANEVILRDGAVAADKSIVGMRGYTIQPRSPELANNWFAVASRNGRTVVAAHRGDVLIARAGAAPLLVPAGSYAAFPGEAPSDEDDDDEKKGGVKDTSAKAPASESWTIGSLSHKGSVILVTTIGAAAATGTALGFALNDNPVSPQ
jgi:hypothetical protein